MFEISSQGRNCLIDFIKAGRLYKDAVYNFTFESRFTSTTLRPETPSAITPWTKRPS